MPQSLLHFLLYYFRLCIVVYIPNYTTLCTMYCTLYIHPVWYTQRTYQYCSYIINVYICFTWNKTQGYVILFYSYTLLFWWPLLDGQVDIIFQNETHLKRVKTMKIRYTEKKNVKIRRLFFTTISLFLLLGGYNIFLVLTHKKVYNESS